MKTSAEANKALVARIFRELAAGNRRALLSRTVPDCTWTVTGSCPISGVFHNRQDFYEKVLISVTSRLTGSVQPTVTRLLAEGNLVVVEWSGVSRTKKGTPYNNQYCWILRIEDEMIQEGTIYSDTELVTRVLAE